MNNEASTSAAKQAEQFRTTFDKVKTEVGRMMVGQEDVIDGVLTALMAGGHVLLEGVPGLGKTMLVRSLGEALDLNFSRIQFTPDMMPADIQGTSILVEKTEGGQEVQFREGPLVSSLVLADEINRATPKTQSALLEAMQEKQMTVGNRTIKLEEPYCVMATQNPVEQEGTYPLARGPARPLPVQAGGRLPGGVGVPRHPQPHDHQRGHRTCRRSPPARRSSSCAAWSAAFRCPSTCRATRSAW